MKLYDSIKKLLGKKYSACLEILEMLYKKGVLASTEIIRRRGVERRESTRQALKRLENAGLIEVVPIKGKRERLYHLTDIGLKLFEDPLCESEIIKLYIAGHDTAIKAAHDYCMRSNTKLNWLIGAGKYWTGLRFRRDACLSLLSDFVKELFVDSGAQQFYRYFSGFDYPYNAKAYLEFAVRVNANLIATLDLPLDILAPRGLPVSEGIKRTVEHGVECVCEAEKLGVANRIVPVLQGYDDPSQWLECLDLYKQHGITPSKFKMWGIGSLCMTRSTRLARSVLQEVRRALGHGCRVHVFGLNLRILRKVIDLIDSYDTSAWVYWAKSDGAVLIWSTRRMRFMHFKVRDDHRYDTMDLMEVNLIQLLEMHRHLSSLAAYKMQHNNITIGDNT